MIEPEVVRVLSGQEIDQGPRIVSVNELIESHPHQSEPIVDGLLRRGETMNLIAAPKVGKSWLAHSLASAVVSGNQWLGFGITSGNVLVIDNELHKCDLAERLRMVCPTTSVSNCLDILPLRGHSLDIDGLSELLIDIEPGSYSLIVLDALYRFLPTGVSENDNAAMMRIYNVLDGIAGRTESAIVVVHHSSKGDQSGKSITDFGSGAGSIARATDTHVAIRQHEQASHAVFEAVTRSFAPFEPFTMKWSYPTWERTDLAPALATRSGRHQDAQKRRDDEADRVVREAFNGKSLSVSQLRSKTDMGSDRIKRALKRLEAIRGRSKNRRTGKCCDRYRLPKVSEVE